MSKILYIKANPKPDAESRTFRISEAFIETYRRSHPDDEIVILDLYREGIVPLSREDLRLHVPKQGESYENTYLNYAYQFVGADKYVIAAPMWNLGIPSILKAYIDYISVTGITFHYTAKGPEGLCRGKKMVHITTTGGDYSSPQTAGYEMGDRYLRTIMGFLGITDFSTIRAEKLDTGIDVEKAVAEAVQSAQSLAEIF
ncbi:MAG TPA: FMN-dependent NADH-azoreductase [Clostridia bacterium]|nr:FMN-dependent NADH-azoreductase [Clostridia bacterium]